MKRLCFNIVAFLLFRKINTTLKYIFQKFGGPDGELAASLRYLNQRFAMPYGEVKGLLTDIGVLITVLHLYLRIIIHILSYNFNKEVIV